MFEDDKTSKLRTFVAFLESYHVDLKTESTVHADCYFS